MRTMSSKTARKLDTYPTIRKQVELDRGVRGVLDRLADQRDEIATLERRLRAAKKRRLALIQKARYAGLSLRKIEPFAGVSNVRIHQLERRPHEGR